MPISKPTAALPPKPTRAIEVTHNHLRFAMYPTLLNTRCRRNFAPGKTEESGIKRALKMVTILAERLMVSG
jgi:hypothetical protein